MDLNKAIAESAVDDLKNMWGGNLPSWEDYKKAAKNGRVRANKTVAAEAINMQGIPKGYVIIYGLITLWLGFLIFPLTVIVWFLMSFSAWWILGSVFAAWFLVKLSRYGHCQGMIHAAEIHEPLYELLVRNGAFLFSPDSEINLKS